MSNGAQMLQTLRDHRPLLLACEAIGWLHMTGKAHPDFLRHHGGAGVDYDDRDWLNSVSPPFPWDAKLSWLLDQRTPWHEVLSSHWPATLTEFIRKHRERDPGILGLLQAAHGMASGIEKNVPTATSRYLNQDATHMWLASPFGYPTRNLLADPLPLLQPHGWRELLERIEKLLDQLAELGSSPPRDPEPWWEWREHAIGREGWLRQAFLSTLAETRLPNNDVTLWDQSYVAAALFKSALAGAILEDGFPWGWKDIARVLNINVQKKGGGDKDFKELDRQDREAIAAYLKTYTRWRVLTVGLGTRHYEVRAVKIGDWVGAQRVIEDFFKQVRKLIEADLALGSLVYRDDETLAFTFPGKRDDGKGSFADDQAECLCAAIRQEVDKLAQSAELETPPLCKLSTSTRSFVPMVAELRKVRDQLAVPIARGWTIPNQTPPSAGTRHVCPVCLVRFNEPPASANTENARKSYPCGVCRERRRGRLDAWLAGEGDTIWISEVADANDRVALLSLSFDLEPWLEGAHVDSLRAQSIAEWRRFNPVLKSIPNPIDPGAPLESLRRYVQGKLSVYDKNDPVLSSLQEGYQHENNWLSFFSKIVEDRADAPEWNRLDDDKRARWLAHQLFRKLPSPGRVHRFWRTCEAFFDELLERFREIAAVHPNRWRTRRLALVPADGSVGAGWEDRETYAGRWGEGPFEVLYLDGRKGFLTIGNLARCLNAEQPAEVLRGQELELKSDDGQVKTLVIQSVRTPEKLGVYAPVIPLDRSARRFRVLVPLDRATACIETAIAKWQEEFARVWDRMPLRIGVVAFPRLTPFQAVIEAVRNAEAALDRQSSDKCSETWRVLACRTRQGVTSLSVEHERGNELIVVPTRVPDGRKDVFYPYVRVEDGELRSARDFKHPEGHVYRHMGDLRPGDGIVVHPSRIAAVFLDTTARRFESHDVRPLGEFERMRATWELLVRHAPSLAALRGAWSEIEERSRGWRDPDGRWLPGAKKEWLDLVRAILGDRLKVRGAALESLVEAVAQGTLQWALEWHLTWLKEGLEGAGT